ncbi:hypothetical protein MKX03_014596 [Papaver bracteatum]|nr:hypothetical protein MKX03_014596 [Papaver bracteatum]
MLTVKFPFMVYVIRIVITFAIVTGTIQAKEDTKEQRQRQDTELRRICSSIVCDLNGSRTRSSYNVPVAAKKRILMKANKSWKYRKATLYAICEEFLKNGTVAELRNNVPEGVKKEDWPHFLDIYLSKKFEEARERGKVARSSVITPHSTGRKGIPRVEHQMDIPYDPLHPKHVAAKKVEEVREIYERDPNSSSQKHLDSDAVSSVGGSEIYHDIVSYEMNALDERFNAFVAERQDNNTSQPSTAPPLQNQATGCILRNLRKKVVALGRVNFSTSPNDENYEVIVDVIVDKHMELCVGDGKLGDIVLGEMIEWPKQYVTRSVGC